MDKSHAEAIAEAMLNPEPGLREELQRKRASEASQLARQRKIALCTLIGFAPGAAIAYALGESIGMGTLLGSFAGSAIGWIVSGRSAN